jgi:phage terminase small subunit
MPALKNGKHEKFVKAICIGNMSNADAYRSAYGTEMSVSVASAAANRLLKSVKVMARVSELQAKVSEKYEITIESMIREFAEAAAGAKEEKQYGPVMTALTAKAKLAGLWVDRAENLNGNYAISDKPLTDEEWAERFVKD